MCENTECRYFYIHDFDNEFIFGVYFTDNEFLSLWSQLIIIELV